MDKVDAYLNPRTRTIQDTARVTVNAMTLGFYDKALGYYRKIGSAEPVDRLIAREETRTANVSTGATVAGNILGVAIPVGGTIRLAKSTVEGGKALYQAGKAAITQGEVANVVVSVMKAGDETIAATAREGWKHFSIGFPLPAGQRGQLTAEFTESLALFGSNLPTLGKPLQASLPQAVAATTYTMAVAANAVVDSASHALFPPAPRSGNQR